MAEVLIGTVTDNNGVVINVYGAESGGNTTFRIKVVEGYADLRGFFFDYTGTGITLNNTTDDAFDQNSVLIMDGTAVTASYMGTSADGNDITKVGSSDNNLNGTGEVFDAGVEIGTSGIGKNDVGSVTFTINGLTLTEIDGLSFGIRATSVGDTLADRSGSVKLIGEFDVPEANTPPVAVADTDDATEAGGVDNGTAGTDATGNVLDNDTDADVGDTKEVTTTGAFVGTYGTLTLNADGTYTYVIDNTDTDVQALRTSGQTLSESFNYTMKDGAGATSSSTLTITIHGANDNPVAVADTNAGDPVVESGVNPGNTPFPGDGSAAGNVLANDTDPDTGETATLAVSAVNGVGGNVGNAVVGTYGSVTINAAGGYSYTLNNADGDTNALTQGQAVSDVFSYTIVDAFGATSTANLTIDITGTNDGPTANADTNAGDPVVESGVNPGNTPFPGDGSAAGNVLANDTDPDTGETATLAVSAVNGVGGNVGNAVVGTYGSVTINAAGGYSYTLNNADGDTNALTQGQAVSDVFSYTIVDAFGATSTANLTIDITGTNDGPTANADTNAGDPVVESGVNPGNTPFPGDGSAAGNVLANDTDPDTGETATLAVSAVNGVGGNVGNAVVGTYGSVTINAAGGYSYTLNNADGDTNALTQGQAVSDVFSYTIVDAFGATSTANLTIDITGTNDGPTANADTNAGDPVVESGVNPGNTPFPGDGSAAGNVLANDTDPDTGETATLAVSAVNGVGGNVGNAVVGTYGSVTINAAGGYSYTLNNADGDTNALTQGQAVSDVFSYTIVDAFGATSTANLTIDITGTNDGPTANADTNAGDPVVESGVNPGNTPFPGDGSAAGNVLANDTDPDTGETATLAVSAVNGVGGNVGNAVVGTYGSVTINAAGGYSYTLNNADGDTNALTQGQAVSDVFSYTIVDAFGATSTANLTIDITGTNDGPTANADTNAGDPVVESGVNPGNTPFPGDGSAAGNVLANDTDPDTGETATLAVSAVNGVGGNVGNAVVGTYGSVTINAAGGYSYTLNNADGDTNALTQGQAVSDVFSYTIVDAFGATSTANLTIDITGTNDGPTANADTNAGDPVVESGVNPGNTPFPGDGSAAGNVLANDTDPDTGETATLAVSAVNGVGGNVGNAVVGTYGSVTINAAGGYSYTLNNADGDTNALTQGQAVSDVFSYTIVDAFGATSTANLTIDITGTNDGPTANADTNAGDPVVESGVNPGNTPFPGDGSAAGNVLANDTDPDTGETATLAVSAVNGVGGNVGNAVVGTYGSVTINAAGGYSYTLNNADGDTNALTQGQAVSDVFSYTIVDAFGATSTANLTIDITGTNDGPVAANDNWVLSDTAIAAGIITPFWFTHNDTDPDGNPVFVSAVSSLPAGLTANFSGGQLVDITGTAAAGNYVINYTLSDGSATDTNNTVSLTVLDTTVGNNQGIVLNGNDFSYVDLQAGNDSITGDLILVGNAGIDIFIGGDGNENALSGGGGADSLSGGNDNDVLFGGEGTDALTGGLGNDAFAWSSILEFGDLVTDFVSNAAGNNDNLRFDVGATGTQIPVGDNDTTVENFEAGTIAATDDGTSHEVVVVTDDNIDGVGDLGVQGTINLYNGIGTGALFVFDVGSEAQVWYDGNPSAAGGATLVATLTSITDITNTTFTATDFVFV